MLPTPLEYNSIAQHGRFLLNIVDASTMFFTVPWRKWSTQLAHNEKITGSSPVGTTTFLRSSVVERLAVNQRVVGSNPTGGAKKSCIS